MPPRGPRVSAWAVRRRLPGVPGRAVGRPEGRTLEGQLTPGDAQVPPNADRHEERATPPSCWVP